MRELDFYLDTDGEGWKDQDSSWDKGPSNKSRLKAFLNYKKEDN